MPLFYTNAGTRKLGFDLLSVLYCPLSRRGVNTAYERIMEEMVKQYHFLECSLFSTVGGLGRFVP